ncbi:MAG: hypothetical protein AB3N13_11285 [Arenibacterium sp.]
MATLKTAQDLVNNPAVQKYIEQIDNDAQDALDLADKVISSPTGKLYSSSTLSAYNADYKRLDKCWGDFNAAWNKVVFGKAKDGKQLIKTYTKFVLALEILEQSNIRHEAVMTSGLATVIAAMHAVVLKIIAAKQKRLSKMEQELAAMQKLLIKAKKEVTEAEVQLALNVAVTAVTMCLGPVGWGARIGLALGGIAVHVAIDASLGPSSGSFEGTANTVAGESVELVDKLSKGSKKIAGGAAAVVTLGMDIGEIGQAKEIVKKIQKELPKLAQEYASLAQESKKWSKQIDASNKALISAAKVYRSAAKKAAKSKKSRQELLKEFKQWK